MKPKALGATPSVGCGGAEQWLLDLMVHSKQWIDWLPLLYTGKTIPKQNKIADFNAAGIPVLMGDSAATYLTLNPPDIVIVWGGGIGWFHRKEPTRLPPVWVVHSPIVWIAQNHHIGYKEAYPVVKELRCINVAVSKKCLDAFDAEDRPSVHIIYNGIDPNRCAITEDRSQIRKRYQIADDKYVVGYFGRIAPIKNVHTLADAIKLLPDRFVGLFVGSSADSYYTSDSDRIIVAPWTNSPGNTLNAFDCFVQVSFFEGFSLSLLEAMYCKLPCIVTPVGGVEELEEQFGPMFFKVPENPTPQQIADKILEVESMDKTKLAAILQKQHNIVKENFLVQHMAQNWTRLIYNVLKRPCPI